MITLEDLQLFFDEEGLLLKDNMNRFIASKGIIKLDKFGNVSIIENPRGAHPYFEMREEIRKLLIAKHYKNKGKMGTTKDQSTQHETNKEIDINEAIKAF